jgi:hypothetical protein
MKVWVSILIALGWLGWVNAAPPEESSNIPTDPGPGNIGLGGTTQVGVNPLQEAAQEPKPGRDLGTAKAKGAVKLDKAPLRENAWSRASYGVVGQFVQAPTVVAPINPVAPPEAGTGKSNLNRDTMTGRVMGLCLLKFEF